MKKPCENCKTCCRWQDDDKVRIAMLQEENRHLKKVLVEFIAEVMQELVLLEVKCECTVASSAFIHLHNAARAAEKSIEERT